MKMVKKYSPRTMSSTIRLTLLWLMLLTFSIQASSALGFTSILTHGGDEAPFEYDPMYFSGPEGEQKYAQCLNNLNAATKKTAGIFTRKAFLTFLTLQSNGQIKEKTFNASIIQFVHVYWVATCTVNPSGCTDSQGEPLADILAYQDPDDGHTMGQELCERIDVILNRMNSAAPTMKSPSMGMPTLVPAPNQMPALYPSPNQMPAHVPSPSQTAPSIESPVAGVPTRFPTRRPTVSPTVSAAPSQAPTFGDSFTLTFSIEYTVANPKSLIQTWSNNIIASVLQTLDARCGIVGGVTSSTCPFTYQSSAFVIDRNCIDGGPTVPGAQCALVLHTVHVRSSSDLVSESMMDAIQMELKDADSVDALAILLIL